MVREHRVGVALERLVAGGVISADQRGAILRAVDAEERAGRAGAGRVLAEIVAYLGAGLVLAGLALFLGRAWTQVAQTGRVVLLLVVAGCAVGGAVVLAGGCDGVFRRVPIASAGRSRLAAVLLALAAGAVCGAVATALGDGDGAEIAASVAGLLMALLGYLLVPSLLGMAVLGAFGVASVVNTTGEIFDYRSVWPGVLLMLLGALWFALAWARLLVAEWAGYLIGGLIAVGGAQTVAWGDSLWRPALTLLVGLACFTLYALRPEPVLVLGGAAAVAGAVAQTVAEHTDGGPAAASAVLALGAVVLTIGLIAALVGPRRQD
ncbi:DUF2157 domain-containing protein [Nocardia asteroides]|uniref:DUF2157 domain-containing protein n=1 Tax=Nocardia asteroides TaxID=1824 RepID=UPI001E414601|nr:DUF2157 domain-containing protein [Nocardia asteroides]UGT53749.1 hypothetical protein LTT85_24155 [Nocardia asteroides]